jgi:hypothetical protein
MKTRRELLKELTGMLEAREKSNNNNRSRAGKQKDNGGRTGKQNSKRDLSRVNK